MAGPIAMILILIIGPMFLIFWNKRRIRGKMLCYFVKEDKSILPELCELRNDFVIHGDYAYDVYPDFVRIVRYPTGWPSLLQELIPCSLYDERDGVPLDWVHIGERKVRAMELRSALDENWLRKLVHEAATVEGSSAGGFSFNWRKVLPIILIVGGIIGFIVISKMGGGGIPFFGGG